MTEPNYYHPNDDGLCRHCGGSGMMESRIHHIAPGFTIAVDRKTEPCPKCNPEGTDDDGTEG